MGERARRRLRDLVTQLAFEGLSENEIGRARISMMARSDLLHARAGYRSARPTTVLKIQLATHGPVRRASAYPLIAAREQTFREGRLGPQAAIPVSSSCQRAARVHSGNPAFRRPSINSFALDCPPRAIYADIVKAGSN